jgi:class 3 adenylate cyclase
MRNRGCSLCASLAIAAIPAAAAAADGPYVDLSASAIWQDNVTNATSGDGILGAFTLESCADASWLRAADFSTILSWGVAATADICTTYSGLDSFSVVRDGVNIAARLQDLTRMSQYRADILVSAATLAAAKGRYAVRALGAAPVRGRDEPVEIFAVDGLAAPDPA